MPGSDTSHPAQSHDELPFKPHFSGFVPEYFLTARDTEMMQQLSQTCPNTWFYPILFLPHLQLQRTPSVLSRRLDSFWTKQKWKSEGKKPAFMGKKWGNGCLWDINLPFEMSCWQKSSKGFTLPQELRFWKKYDRLMGKEWIYNAACLKTLQTLSGYPKQLALQVSRGSQASSGECPAPAARQGCWVTRARWIRGGCTPIRSFMYNF